MKKSLSKDIIRSENTCNFPPLQLKKVTVLDTDTDYTQPPGRWIPVMIYLAPEHLAQAIRYNIDISDYLDRAIDCSGGIADDDIDPEDYE